MIRSVQEDSLKLTGSHTINAPRSQVFVMLQDPAVLAKATPGVKTIERESEDTYKASLELGIGPVRGKFDGHIQVVERSEPETMTLAVQGEGGPGGVKAVGKLRLEEKAGKTIIHWEGEPQMSGRIAAVGGRLVGGVAKKLAGEFFSSVDKQAATYQVEG